MDWAVPDDEGDGAAAAREIERWRAGLPDIPPLDGILAQIRERLQLLCVTPLVRNDPECVGILHAMRSCSDMAEFDAGVTRVQARVTALLRERAAARRPPDVAPPSPTPEPAPTAEPSRRPARAAWRALADP